MRLGVLDIGSNTGHRVVVDAYGGAAPLPAYSFQPIDVHSSSRDIVDLPALEICPWALREGVILERLDHPSFLGPGQ
ncbi:hypothetical protein SAMN04487968_104248 [Nocardioides terrae]|uniref:Exopolyphosphatase / guanosine-5'-triphosphate,3'-diphosphate pyrophosphatase n=1 Tax=Nocardioides terrae TaxID=574651 RepID=A0A1I1HAT6_9ACTN|nr:hypothetical protein [Nocardioides terrae]SFC20835.1 hypothetical protein SAMN04487968_104248 [Nocardioides terrae]